MSSVKCNSHTIQVKCILYTCSGIARTGPKGGGGEREVLISNSNSRPSPEAGEKPRIWTFDVDHSRTKGGGA